MKIQILGGGCPKCKTLEANVREAATRVGIAVEIEKVTDSNAILEMGVLTTPGYAIDGVVQSFGRVFGVQELEAALRHASR